MTVRSDQRKIIYQGNGTTTQFAVPFYFIRNADIEASVYNGTTTTALVLGTDYTLSGAGNEAGGTLTTVSPVPSGSEIAILRTVAYKQEMDIPENDIFPSQNMERALDRLTMQTQQLAEQSARSITVDVFSDVSPAELVGEIEDIWSIKDDITTVSGISSNVTAVAGNATNINTVAGSISNVNAVGANIANVNAVNANKTNINTVAGISSNVTTVAGISSDVTAVKNNAVNITSVAGNATNINAVKNNATNINAVAGNATNINAVNANKTNIDTVAGISSNVTTVAGISSDVTAVKNNASNITAVAGNTTNINAVNANKTNIDAVAGDLTNINAVAADLTNIDSASTYATNANVWAEGTDEQVQALGGTHSAKVWADATSGANKDLSNLTTLGNDKFVTKNTTQTISGDKTFSGTLYAKKGGTYSASPSTNQEYFSLSAQDSSGKTTGKLDTYTATTGTTYSRLIAFLPTDPTKYGVVSAVVDKNGVPSSYAVTPTDTTSSSSKQIATVGWVNSTGNNVVHLNGRETITGGKAFTNTVVSNGELNLCSTTPYNTTNPPASSLGIGTIRWSVNATSGSTGYLGGGMEFARIQPVLNANGWQSCGFILENQETPQKGQVILNIAQSADGSTYYAIHNGTVDTIDSSTKIATTGWCTTASKKGNLFGAPNYSAAVDITVDASTTYTAPANGWILCRIIPSNTAITIDGVQINQGHYGDNVNYGCDVIAPIALGSVVASNTALPSYTVLKFIPCK